MPPRNSLISRLCNRRAWDEWTSEETVRSRTRLCPRPRTTRRNRGAAASRSPSCSRRSSSRELPSRQPPGIRFVRRSRTQAGEQPWPRPTARPPALQRRHRLIPRPPIPRLPIPRPPIPRLPILLPTTSGAGSRARRPRIPAAPVRHLTQPLRRPPLPRSPRRPPLSRQRCGKLQHVRAPSHVLERRPTRRAARRAGSQPRRTRRRTTCRRALRRPMPPRRSSMALRRPSSG